MTVYTLTTGVAFTDPTTVPTGCPVIVQHAAQTIYVIILSPDTAPYAACAQLPSGVAVGDVLEIFGDYTNPRGVVLYPASGETIQNIPIGPNCGNVQVGAGGKAILQKLTATDWRMIG
jgi:hypothetical protein